jgi:hypothetical protein
MEAKNDNQELATNTKRTFLEIYNPDNINRKLVKVRTVHDALKAAEDYPTAYQAIGALRRHYGEKMVETVIKLYLVELCELVNLKRPLTEKQIDTIAAEVVASYYNLNIADIHVIFRKAKNGDFGNLYESLDMPKVMSWFADYFDERCEIAAEQSANSNTGDKHGNYTPERMRKYFDDLEKIVNKNNKR